MTKRAWNIVVRTVHIGVAGALFGGHVFDVDSERLMPWLYATIATGVFLAVIEAWPETVWFHQGRGVAVMAKALLLCMILLWWDARVPILVAVIAIAGVGSHMPGKYRYYSLWYRRVLD